MAWRPGPGGCSPSSRWCRAARPTKPRKAAAGEAAIDGAQPLQHNGYKVPLLRNLVRRAIRGSGDS